ncbi:hypothetical protein UFOVP1054_11 [uncultured Caudovirales phage]|uniref:Uncharacterized protein n=1 Tax=uncultured Caudovirales phage TaxID=2100421 RepID=A0A6J5Q8Y7_9CAUD|nr:hypothetical protein UFOVP1054_11 [uncultured Caudovirales phage]
MSQPILKVLIGFQTTVGFGQPFQLDDAFYGVLNTAGRGTLGGVQMVDVTTFVQSVSISRGRSRQLDEFNCGTAQINLWNKTRTFDPLNQSSPYWIGGSTQQTGIVPRLPVQILANEIPIYTGLVTDWDINYDMAFNDIATVQCADQFTVLSNQQLNAVTPSTEKTGARINNVLNYAEINYQGARAIDTGSSTLGAYAIPQDTNCLNYLQQINTSEQGFLFMSANGTLTFKGRSSVLNPVSGATFNGDGTGLPFNSLMNQYGDELLYNYINTQSPAGAIQTTSNATSIAQYQAQQYSLLDLLNSTTTEVAALGNYLLGRYQNPILRFNGLQTQLSAMTTAQQNIALSLDLTSICTVVKNFVTGTPSSDSQTLIVSGVNHTITPGNHVVSYTFESTDSNAYFTLNDTIFGTLSTTNLLSF